MEISPPQHVKVVSGQGNLVRHFDAVSVSDKIFTCAQTENLSVNEKSEKR